MSLDSKLERAGVAILAPRMCVLGHDPCGGSEVVLWRDANLIAGAGIPVRMYARAAREGAPVKLIPTRTNSPLITSIEYCGKFLAMEPCAVVMSQNEPTLAVLAPDRAIVRYEWDTPLPRYWNVPGFLGRFQRAFYLFPSRAERKIFQDAHPRIPAESQFVNPYGIDLDAFKPSNGQPRPALRVGFAGQWVPRKGIHTLLDAWPKVRSAIPAAELDVLDGSNLWKVDSPIPGVPEAIARVREEESKGTLRVHPALAHSQMPAFWNSVSVAVVPSLYEPLAGVVLEAMASGVPVVASDVGGFPDMIVEGRSGMLVPPSDPDALARALISLLNDSQLRDSMAAGARRRAEEFSLERRRSDLLALLHLRLNPSREEMKYREQLQRTFADGKG
ncbi:MAG TPA: glycosyltransferase family 4 protein [Candidatus Solibacter sp.]|nr:glycosyltransferase family 4 protein [Candidatus Solibacter sp.]